jgi:hypothetical protein
MNPLVLVTFLYKLGGDMIHTYMKHPEVVKFLNSGEKFDVCVIEMFNADAFLVRRRLNPEGIPDLMVIKIY